MKFKDMVNSVELTDADVKHIEVLCKNWLSYSNAVGMMNKTQVLQVLKYLIIYRPFSKTLGERAVQRFNILNKVKWEDLTNGDNGKGSREILSKEG